MQRGPLVVLALALALMGFGAWHSMTATTVAIASVPIATQAQLDCAASTSCDNTALLNGAR